MYLPYNDMNQTLRFKLLVTVYLMTDIFRQQTLNMFNINKHNYRKNDVSINMHTV